VNPENNFSNKILEWLNKQGYPTEYRVANICHDHGFRVWQGFHVHDDSSGTPREIDVLAVKDSLWTDLFIRVCSIIECKWSKDKPWVVLTSPYGQMGSAACVAQTISNSLGSAILSLLARDPDLHKLELFSTPDRPGFSGRQVFSDNNDLFYAAMQSTVDISTLLMGGYDDIRRLTGTLPESAVAAFPTIVVDGRIFEACFDEVSRQMQVHERSSIRCHWRGARSWKLHSTVDIVTLAQFDEFISKRAQEVQVVLKKIEMMIKEVVQCLDEKSLRRLVKISGTGGLASIPHLIHQIHNERAKSRSDPQGG
jgi:hypothetical protein